VVGHTVVVVVVVGGVVTVLGLTVEVGVDEMALQPTSKQVHLTTSVAVYPVGHDVVVVVTPGHNTPGIHCP